MIARNGYQSTSRAGAAQAILTADDLHVLVVARDARVRYALSDRLLDAGLRVTLAATFGVVEVLLGAEASFDLMITTQSAEETARFGLPQLARSIDADLPILVLDDDTVNAPAVVALVQDAVSRWPLRDHAERALH